jgi:hypothetical protein
MRMRVTRWWRERELASDTRAGRFARTKARRAQRTFLRRNWKLFLAVTAGMLLPALAALPLLPNSFARGLLVGVAGTSVVALLSFWVVQATGTAPIMMGDLGEQWTAQKLRSTRKAGWKVVNDLALQAWNVDHILVGPGGVFVVESKWSSQAWDVVPPGQTVAKACGQVDAAAKTISSWLRPLDVGPVYGLVVLWGANARDLPPSQTLLAGDRQVTVLAGPRLKPWLKGLPGNQLSAEQVDTAWDQIATLCRRRDEYDPAASAVPLSASEVGARATLSLAAACAAFLLAATWLGTSPSPWFWPFVLTVMAAPAGILIKRAPATSYLAWGWLAGLIITALLLLWYLSRWLLNLA